MPRVQLSYIKNNLVVFSTIVFFVCHFFLVTNSAVAADSLSYSGRLVQTNGAPVSGPVDLLIELAYATSTTAGTVVCSQNFSSVALSNGVFHLKLNLCPGTLADVLAQVPDGKYAAIRVTNLSATPDKVYDFQELNSMPFANIAGTAKQLVQMTAVKGQVLEWDGAKWWPTTLGAGTLTGVTSGGLPIIVSGGTAPVISIEQASGSKSGYLSAADWNTFNSKQGVISGGALTDYYRGNNTWATLKTDAVPEAGSLTNLYFTNARALGVPLSGFAVGSGAIIATDTILTAFGKTQGQIDTLTTAGSSYLKKNSATGESITGVVNVGTIGSLNLTYTPTNATDATNKSYVDSKVSDSAALKLNKSGDSMAGALTLNSDLIIKNGAHTVTISGDPAATAAYSLTLPPAAGAAGNVLKTDAAGKLSWADVSAGTPTTNANMTGPITSVGNATSVASQTGTGSTFVMSASPTITTPTFSGIATGSISGNAETVTTNANMTGPITSVGNATSVASQTGTGSTFVMSASPTITTPTFSGTATGSISGNAATVTTNANMTGPITSVGNATSINAQTGTGSTFVMSESPTLTTPTFSGVATGSISGNAATVTTNANLTGDVTSVGNATTIGASGTRNATTYLAGDNTWKAFADNIFAAPLPVLNTTGINYSNHTIAASDSMTVAFNKLLFDQGDYISRTATSTINGTLAINTLTGNLVVPDAPFGMNSAVNQNYVLALFNSSGAKTANSTASSISNTSTSSTDSLSKIGLDIQSTGAWSGATATNTGLNVNVSGGTANYAALFNGGDVGIGTTSPKAKLDVNGTVKIANGSTVCDASQAGTLRFVNNSLLICKNSAWFVVQLTAAAAGFGFSPASATMNLAGGVSPGSYTTFTLTNTGTDNSSSITISLSNTKFELGTDNCTGQTLTPGATCTVDVRAKNTVSESYSTNLTATAAAASMIAVLSGTSTGFSAPIPDCTTFSHPEPTTAGYNYFAVSFSGKVMTMCSVSVITGLWITNSGTCYGTGCWPSGSPKTGTGGVEYEVSNTVLPAIGHVYRCSGGVVQDSVAGGAFTTVNWSGGAQNGTPLKCVTY